MWDDNCRKNNFKLFFMKCFLVIHLLILIVYCGCTEYKPDPIENFIPGTYIRFSQHEFGTEYDTLVITLQNNTTNEYTILRRWKYERVLDGKVIEPEYRRTITTGVYKNKSLEEVDTGLLYTIDLKNRMINTGSVQYQKLY
jgi:hypothetical protein